MKNTTRENEIGKNILYKYQLQSNIINDKREIAWEAAKTGAGVVGFALGLTGLILLGKMCLGHYSSGEELTYASMFITKLEGTGAAFSGLGAGAGGFLAVKSAINTKNGIRDLKIDRNRLEELEKLESNTEGKAKVLKR